MTPRQADCERITSKPELETDGHGGYNDLAGRNGSGLCGNATMLRDMGIPMKPIGIPN